MLDDVKPLDISGDYPIEPLSLVSAMLSTDRDVRPTASKVKDQLAVIATKLLTPAGEKCATCQMTFTSKTALRKHMKKNEHGCKDALPVQDFKITHCVVEDHPPLTIRGAADAPAKYYYDDAELDAPDPSPCVVCKRQFDTKRQFFSHLGGPGGYHYRNAKFVLKRKAEIDLEKADERLAKWNRKDMGRHN